MPLRVNGMDGTYGLVVPIIHMGDGSQSLSGSEV